MSRSRKSPGRHVKREIRHADLNSPIKVYDEDDLICALEKLEDQDCIFLILDGVQDPHNLGACLRTCDGAGVKGVVVPKDRAAPLTDTVRNTSCGGAENIPVYRVKNLAHSLGHMKEYGFNLVGTEDETNKYIYDIDLTGKLGMVLGAEGGGMRRLTRDACDIVVKIPMAGKVDCLNVSVATGVCLYESVRQRLNKNR